MKLVVNLAPADIRKEGSAYDLPIALAILSSLRQINGASLDQYMIMGELSLDGSLRPIKGALPIAIEARKNGFKGFVLPKGNAEEAAIVNDIDIVGVNTLEEAVAFFEGDEKIKPIVRDTRDIFYDNLNNYEVDFADVQGHESVKNIDEALDLEASRLEGVEEKLLADPKLISRPHQHYSYIARGHYAPQIERLYKHFNRDNVLVMTTEKLVSDSEASLSAIQSFIGFEIDPSIQLEKRNASSKFEPNPDTVTRLTEEYTESNKQLADLLDIEIPWA